MSKNYIYSLRNRKYMQNGFYRIGFSAVHEILVIHWPDVFRCPSYYILVVHTSYIYTEHPLRNLKTARRKVSFWVVRIK